MGWDAEIACIIAGELACKTALAGRDTDVKLSTPTKSAVSFEDLTDELDRKLKKGIHDIENIDWLVWEGGEMGGRE